MAILRELGRRIEASELCPEANANGCLPGILVSSVGELDKNVVVVSTLKFPQTIAGSCNPEQVNPRGQYPFCNCTRGGCNIRVQSLSIIRSRNPTTQHLLSHDYGHSETLHAPRIPGWDMSIPGDIHTLSAALVIRMPHPDPKPR